MVFLNMAIGEFRDQSKNYAVKSPKREGGILTVLTQNKYFPKREGGILTFLTQNKYSPKREGGGILTFLTQNKYFPIRENPNGF